MKLARETEVFAEVNLDSLRADMAAGQGEYVTTFASLLGAVVVVVDPWVLPEPPLPRPVTGSVRPGVGSKRYQPTVEPSQTSGHAWALRPRTWYTPSLPRSPGVKPTATRAGSPMERANAAYVPANCSQ